MVASLQGLSSSNMHFSARRAPRFGSASEPESKPLYKRPIPLLIAAVLTASGINATLGKVAHSANDSFDAASARNVSAAVHKHTGK